MTPTNRDFGRNFQKYRNKAYFLPIGKVEIQNFTKLNNIPMLFVPNTPLPSQIPPETYILHGISKKSGGFQGIPRKKSGGFHGIPIKNQKGILKMKVGIIIRFWKKVMGFYGIPKINGILK